MESIFCLLLVMEEFSLQKFVMMLEEAARGQLNMAGKAKLLNSIRSPFETMVL